VTLERTPSQIAAGGGGAVVQTVAAAGPTTVDSGRHVRVLCDASSAEIDLGLPVGQDGDLVEIVDVGLAKSGYLVGCGARRIQVSGDGLDTINGLADFVLRDDGGRALMIYDAAAAAWTATLERPSVRNRIVLWDEHFVGFDPNLGANLIPTRFETDTNSGASVARIPVEADHPGIIELRTGGRATVFQRSSDPGTNGYRFGDGIMTLRARLRVTTLSTAAQEYQFMAGWGNGPGDTNPDPGIFFLYDRLGPGANWIARCNDGATTSVDTGIAVSAGAWVDLAIVVAADGSAVYFTIDDVLVATIAVNIPTACRTLMMELQKTNGGTQRQVGIDRVYAEKRLDA